MDDRWDHGVSLLFGGLGSRTVDRRGRVRWVHREPGSWTEAADWVDWLTESAELRWRHMVGPARLALEWRWTIGG